MNRKLSNGVLLALIFLIGLGLIQIYSVTYIYGIDRFDDGLIFFRKQVFHAFLEITFFICKIY